jgi:hypothetical protein
MHMTSTDLSRSLFLRKHDFSFINGATGVFDWTPITEYYNIAPTSQNADAHAISCIYHPYTHNIPGGTAPTADPARARPRPALTCCLPLCAFRQARIVTASIERAPELSRGYCARAPLA